jgi:signal transduction histidine kinase
MFYQTNWFSASCMAAFLALLWGLYRVRLHAIAHELNLRYNERLAERTRIARELHDTLLQSFQSSLVQMQAAYNLFSRRPEQAVQTLDDAITMAEGAIAESRDAIQDLRSQPAAQGDLLQLLTLTGQDLARAHHTNQEANGSPPIFRVKVEGERRDLDPLLQDEAYRIARELLRNAFRHAQARYIEADIRYDDHLFRMRIRDDGKGIEPETLRAGGRAGHWGLLGMRERAKRVGAQLNFWSGAGAGTEVELSIPAAVAYGANRRGGRFQLLRKKKANS